jgi:hypothetical protein
MNDINQLIKTVATIIGMHVCVPILKYSSILQSNINLKETLIHLVLNLATFHNKIAL